MRVYPQGQPGPGGAKAAFIRRGADGTESVLPVHVEPREDVYRSHMQPLKDAVRFDPAELGRAYDLSKLSAYDRERLGLPPSAAGDKTAAGQDRQGFSIETRDQEERDLVDSMLAQGKSADEIQNALAELRRRRGGEFRQAAEVKPEDPFPSGTAPTGPLGAKPFGEPETVKPNTTEPGDKRGVRAQNDALDRLADRGYRAVQQPSKTIGPDGKPVLTKEMQEKLGLKTDKNPDALIEGRVFDVYSPTTDSVRNIYGTIAKKAGDNQAHRIVLNLRESDVSVRDLRQYLRENPVPKLKEIILIDRNGNISRFFPFKG